MVLVLCLGDLHIPQRSLDLPVKFKKLLLPGKILQILCTGNLNSAETLDYLRTIAPDITLVQGDHDDPSLIPTSSTSTSSTSSSSAFTAAALSKVLTIGTLRIGLIHGHTILPWGDVRALSACARSMDADVLVVGHTHRFEAWEYEGRFFIAPGSATGAFTPFVLPEVEGVAGVKKAEASVDAGDGSTGTTTVDGEGNKENEADAKKECNVNKREEESTSSEIVPSFVLLDVQGSSLVVYVYKLIKGDVKVEKLDFAKKNYN